MGRHRGPGTCDQRLHLAHGREVAPPRLGVRISDDHDQSVVGVGVLHRQRVLGAGAAAPVADQQQLAREQPVKWRLQDRFDDTVRRGHDIEVRRSAPLEEPPQQAGCQVDVHVEPSELHARAAELVALGATLVAEFDEPEGHWITMLDPEGNEFCLH
jgi:hypothetical protein